MAPDRPWRRAGLAILAAVPIFAACARNASAKAQPKQPTSETPVLLITIDTLRADRLGCYGSRTVRTPAIDSLAAEGTRFENALTQVPITLPAHIAILSGTYPMWNGIRDFTSGPLNSNVGLLAEAFSRHGYDTAAFVSAYVLDRSWGLARGFETYDDQFDSRQFETRNPGNIERRGDRTVNRLLAWFSAHETGGAARPFFVWLHLYDPHSPYNPPEPFHTRYLGHLYDGEVAFVDSQLARVFDDLKKAGLYDRTLIVFLADHGESLGEHGEGEHGFFIYDSTLHVPLIFKLPQREASPHVVRPPVGTIDVAPTLLDLLHLQDPISRQFQGTSLASLILGLGSTGAETPVYSETYYPRDSFGWSPLRGISTPRYEYIDAPHPELYDWANDPSETKNLYSEHRALAAALREQLLGLESRYTSQAPQKNEARPDLSPGTVEKLRSLGYLAYSAPTRTATAGGLADPKDRLNTYNAILRAEDLSSAGKLDESDRILQGLESHEPHLYLLPFMLGENAAHERRWDDAERNFLACLKLSPSFEQGIMGLARAYMSHEQPDKAKPWLQLAVHQNSHNFLAYYALAIINHSEENQAEARADLSASIDIKPDFAPSQQELGILLVEAQKYSEALAPLHRAEALGGMNPVLANYLGTACANSGRLDQGTEYYRKALTLEPNYAGARLNLAFAYLKMGNREKARTEFQPLCQQKSPFCQQFGRLFQ